jgi:glycine cleavage system H protein
MEDDGSVVVGITDHAQQSLGELVFVEVPEEGSEFAQGDACAVVESVKAASDVYAPISGKLALTNTALADKPELVNESPYDDGWLISLVPDEPAQLDELMDAEAYLRFVAESDD